MLDHLHYLPFKCNFLTFKFLLLCQLMNTSVRQNTSEYKLVCKRKVVQTVVSRVNNIHISFNNSVLFHRKYASAIIFFVLYIFCFPLKNNYNQANITQKYKFITQGALQNQKPVKLGTLSQHGGWGSDQSSICPNFYFYFFKSTRMT